MRCPNCSTALIISSDLAALIVILRDFPRKQSNAIIRYLGNLYFPTISLSFPVTPQAAQCRIISVQSTTKIHHYPRKQYENLNKYANALDVAEQMHQELGIRFFLLSSARRYVSSETVAKKRATSPVLSPLRALICIPNYPLANTPSRARDMLLQSNESPRAYRVPVPDKYRFARHARARRDLRRDDELRVTYLFQNFPG